MKTPDVPPRWRAIVPPTVPASCLCDGESPAVAAIVSTAHPTVAMKLCRVCLFDLRMIAGEAIIAVASAERAAQSG